MKQPSAAGKPQATNRHPAGDTLGGLVAWGRRRLRATGASPLDAEVLLAFAADTTRSAVLAFPERSVLEAAADAYRSTLERRALGEPLAYITGRREFFSLVLGVTAATLVPRPETELAVEETLARLPHDERASVLDLGTGCGAIALAIKHARPMADVTAVDISAAALAVARGNAGALGLEVRWLRSDWYGTLGGRRFDLIVANPPYVASSDAHLAGALRFEPRVALDGGPDGLAAIRAVLAGAAAHLEGGGCLLLEHGHDQRASVAALAADHGLRALAARIDSSGRPRLAVLGAA